MIGEARTIDRVADRALDQLLEELTARIQSGEVLDIEACVAAHPEFAAELERMLPAMQLLVAFGNSQPTLVGATAAIGLAETAATGLAESTRVLGDFRIGREIGRGGMGVVYEAEQISIGRTVALKVLPFAALLDERRLARFRNEVRAAGQLHHTNIVPIYAVGAERGVHFYAMQLIAGQSLAEVIDRMRDKPGGAARQAKAVASDSGYVVASMPPLPSPPHRGEGTGTGCGASTADETQPAAKLSTIRTADGPAYFRTVAQLGVQAAEALEHAHSFGIVHRDVKPSNLLVDERGTLWLTDFGLARLGTDGDLTTTGDLLGTLRYMSPEQTRAAHDVVDHRTDVYSLGATLYELITLQPAFDGANRAELVRQIGEKEPMAPRRINAAIPSDLETIVLKAMAKDAADRYRTAQGLADDLRRFLDHKPIAARRPSLADRGRKWVVRHAALAATAGAALAVVAIVAAAAALVIGNSLRSEARQRAQADANLRVAAESIDRMLSRVSGDRFSHGDLTHAEALAADAADCYEKLLVHSQDAGIRLSAAQAYGRVSDVLGLLGENDKAADAIGRAGELVRELVAEFPESPEYLAALAGNYADRGETQWGRRRFRDAEGPWRQACTLWQDLAERFPQNASYQRELADALSNLSNVAWYDDRLDEAQALLDQAMAIERRLPEALRESPGGWSRQAASLGTAATLVAERGDARRALAMLDQGLALQSRAMATEPNNAYAAEFLYQFYWNIADVSLKAGDPARAAATVETFVDTFPRWRQAYEDGAELLVRCAEAAEVAAGSGAAPATQQAAAPGYRRRAAELRAQAESAHERAETPQRFGLLPTIGGTSP